MIFFAGVADVVNLKLTISGADLRANAPTYCKVVGAKIECNVTSLLANKSFVLTISGSGVQVKATYQRVQDGPVFTRTTP